MKLAGPSNPRALGATGAVAVLVMLGLVIAAPRPHVTVPTAQSILTTSGSPRPGCIGLVAAVPTDDVDGIAPLIAAYDAGNHLLGGQCIDVRVLPSPAGAVADALVRGWKASTDGPAPQVWLPGSSIWVDLVRARTLSTGAAILPQSTPSFAQSPFVIAMPRPMAEALGWPDHPVGFSDLLAIGTNPKGWAAVGHPEWGSLRLGKTNPLLSTSGLNALVAAYFAASRVSADLSLGDLSNPKVLAFVKGVELATVHYGQSATVFLQDLARADAEGNALTYVSAIALDEREVLAYNAGLIAGMNGRKPSVPLAALYPKEGTLISDNPFVVLNSLSNQQRAASDDLLAYLMAAPQQNVLQREGYRDSAGHTASPSTGADGTLSAQPKAVIKAPAGNVLDRLQASWWKVRKPARVLIVVDVSGSMSQDVGGGATKLDLVKAALLASIDQVGDDDEVGLWQFSDQHTELVPIGPAASQRGRLKQAVASLVPEGGTLLYTTVLDAWDYVRKTGDPGHINAVVVLTDGQDNGSPANAYDQLTADLSGQARDSAVRVFTVAYGGDADRNALSHIAQASSGEAYDATDPTLIREVFLAILSNF